MHTSARNWRRGTGGDDAGRVRVCRADGGDGHDADNPEIVCAPGGHLAAVIWTAVFRDLCVVNAVADGVGTITETIFENRFQHVLELQRSAWSCNII